MNLRLKKLTEELEDLEKRISAELKTNANRLNYRLERGRAIFSEEVRREHRQVARNAFLWLLDSSLVYVITAPIIYSVLLPALALDLIVTLYQGINFRIYGIAPVQRGDYIIFDRHNLKYLNVIEKMNCIYCEYVNGLIAYVEEIAGRTEQFWCPIRHARHDAPRHAWTNNFVDYGDGQNYHRRLLELRGELRRITREIESRPTPSLKSGRG